MASPAQEFQPFRAQAPLRGRHRLRRRSDMETAL